MTRPMKDSGIEWIGEIPENWKTIKVKYTSWLKGRIGWQGLTANEYTDVGPFLITGTDFYNGTINWNTCVHITKKRFDEDSDIHVKEGDLLITKDGTIGKVAIVKNCPSEVSLNSGVLLIRNERKYKYFDKYMYYVLLSDEFWRWYTLSQTGQSTIKHLYQAQFYDFEFSFPDFQEQQLIADFLDEKCTEIDGVIEKTRASSEEYKKLKQAVITQAVTKGIRPNRPMKDSGIEWIGKIPAEWKLCRLRHIGSTQNGISKGGEYFGQGYPFVSYGDVYRNYSLPYELKGLIQSTKEEQELYSVKRGDIFFTRTSETIEEVGFSSVCERTIPKATFAGFLIRVRPYDDTLEPGFSKYYFRSNHHRFYLVKQMNLVTRASLGQPLLKGMPVLVPNKDEQIEITSYLDKKCADIDNLIMNKETLISELEYYKKSLIFEYVTGKKEVPA